MPTRAIEVPVLTSRDQEIDALSRAVRAVAPDGRPLEILEAGCGRFWPIKVPGVSLRITGVDTDVVALEARRAKHDDLAETIIGDLRSVDLPAESFDLAYCGFVLEHVDGAEQVLDRLAGALRPGGRLIVRVPDGASVFGFVTKHTPHWSHVLFVKYVKRSKNAGKPGHPPYPTVYDDVVTVRGMREWAGRRGLTVTDQWAANYFMNMFGRLRPVVQFGLDTIARVSRGRLLSTHNDLAFVIDK